MTKQEKEIERWVTVNGARVPIFKDGSIGGPKELADKIKKGTKVGETSGGTFNPKELQKKIDKEKADKKAKEEALKKKANDTFKVASNDVKKAAEAEVSKKKLQAMQDYGITGAKNFTQLQEKMRDYGVAMESADSSGIEKDWRSMNGEKVSLYDKDGNEYRGTFNRYNDGGTEIVNIKKTKDSAKKVANDNEDLKEKQIANNKKEADERSGKQYEWYKQAKKEGRIDKDEEFKDYIDYSPIDDSRVEKQLKRARKMELADEADAYDRAHNEGKYAKTDNNKSYKPGMTKEEDLLKKSKNNLKHQLKDKQSSQNYEKVVNTYKNANSGDIKEGKAYAKEIITDIKSEYKNFEGGVSLGGWKQYPLSSLRDAAVYGFGYNIEDIYGMSKADLIQLLNINQPDVTTAKGYKKPGKSKAR